MAFKGRALNDEGVVAMRKTVLVRTETIGQLAGNRQSATPISTFFHHQQLVSWLVAESVTVSSIVSKSSRICPTR
ncbi:hypothetical protein [Brucella intermedia]|uniref:hypothetical protein n=1 Tax=Brucella intermedia TaxID=94625 RepID=UPI00235E0ED4|nr:hypothetical protein [Brucella intermedia]